MSLRASALAVLLFFATAPLSAEVIWLRNGDRLTGTIVSETKGAVRLKMEWASVLIPKSRIERLVRADGKEEVLSPRTAALVPAATPTPPPVRKAQLVLVVTGASFWQAWDKKEAPADPTLRLQVRIDEEPVATWVDATLDPEDLPGAVVNTFAFTSGDEAGLAAPGVRLEAPEVQPGRVVLRVSVPRGAGLGRHLRVSYQINEAGPSAPAWRDVASAGATIDVAADHPTVIALRQDRGRMEYSRKRMRDVDTFQVDVSQE